MEISLILVLEISLILAVISMEIPLIKVTLTLVSIKVSLMLETLILETLVLILKTVTLIEVPLVLKTLVHSILVLVTVLDILVLIKTRWSRVVVRTIVRVHRRAVLVAPLIGRPGYSMSFIWRTISSCAIVVGMRPTTSHTDFHFLNLSRWRCVWKRDFLLL